MKPVIGITCDYDHVSHASIVHEGYHRAISIFGGLPILLPGNNNKNDIIQLLEIVDGILIIGGNDVDPSFFGEPPHRKLGKVNPYRDEFELELVRQAIEKEKAILGICRGLQVINVAMGGTLYQDIESQLSNTPICHRQKAPTWYPIHSVEMVKGSKLSKIVGIDDIRVNSFHHQAVKDIAPGFNVAGYAPDGIIEAIEMKDHPFVLGLQWHPERMVGKYSHGDMIFKNFIDTIKNI